MSIQRGERGARDLRTTRRFRVLKREVCSVYEKGEGLYKEKEKEERGEIVSG